MCVTLPLAARRFINFKGQTFDQCKRKGLNLASLPPHPYHHDQYPAEYVGEYLAGRRSNPSSVITSWTKGEQICQCRGEKRIYLALNNHSGEMIAAKQVKHPETPCDNMENAINNMVRALQRDSQNVLRNLDHPNILQYLGYEQKPETASLFMEYVPGGSMESWLNRHGSFGPPVTKSFAAQILNGLKHIHSKGIIHRNLKTANILIEMNGLCKISNFEMSKSMLQQKRVHAHLKGSLYWMAPEIVEDNSDQPGYDEKVNIWSLGCLVHEMWTADRPWRSVTTAEVLQQLREKKAPPLPEEVLKMPDAQDFNSLCFQSDPHHRPAANVLLQHPYLELPPDWVFVGFT
ncbi:kinase-like domain-containing protein [Panaeolus papilionaceus]|nr:kinase-like domain-containing protein [Panaeolus papilionaceus]